MVHGPCGTINPDAPCMKDGKCTKNYPKSFSEQTVLSEDGYTIYARPNNGQVCKKKVNGVEIDIDNRWIVPYNPWSIMQLKCHVNMECCISIKAFKYLHKYIYKGHDCTTMAIGQNQDEIKQYIDSHYVSTSEAVWRLFHYDMHKEKPNVVRLAVHTEQGQFVVFDADAAPEDILAAAGSKNSTLTAYFKANADEQRKAEEHPDQAVTTARSLLYQEFPSKWVWLKSKKCWKVRERGESAIGQMYFVHPAGGERFYVRLLLTVVKGATSFADLRTYEGTEYATHQEACLAHGLLQDDSEWKDCLEDARHMQTGATL